MSEPLLLNVAEAAASLGIGRRKMYELLDEKVIASVRIGRARRVPRQELERYVEELFNAR